MVYDDKTALITGGSSGIGLGLARALVERGARVALIATDASKLERAVAGFSDGQAIGISLDVRDESAWPRAVDRVTSTFGPIDFLALNAGAQGGRHPIEAIAEDEWRWMWDVNVGGLYNGLRACLPAMKSRGVSAHVVATASIAALIPRANVSAYGASKAAVLSIMEAVRPELADVAIGASVFCPALVHTDFASTMQHHAPGADDDTFAYMRAFAGQGLDPLEVGRYVLDRIADGDFYIFSHPEMGAYVKPRLEKICAAFDSQEAAAKAFFKV